MKNAATNNDALLPRMTKAQRATWDAYVTAMEAARTAALTLADTLEKYLRNPDRRFHEACVAADRYRGAMIVAEQYHFGAIPFFGSGHIINEEPEALLAFMRDIRGSENPMIILDGERTISKMRYADNGIAGFFALEVRSMRRFGSPRRSAADWQAAREQRAAA